MYPLPVLPANVMVSLSYLLFKCYLEIFSVRNKNCLIFPFLKMNFDASIPFSLIFRPSPLPTPPSSPDYEVERELTLFGSNEYVSPPNSPDYASLYESYIGNITPILLYFSIAVSFLLFFSLKHLRKLYGYSNPTNTTTECAFELRGRCASSVSACVILFPCLLTSLLANMEYALSTVRAPLLWFPAHRPLHICTDSYAANKRTRCKR